MVEADVPACTGVDGVKEQLPRGDVTEGVVRVGQTVRRPAQPQSAAVADYLEHLRVVGFDGAPRYLGRDRSGRDVLDYLDGDVPGDPPELWVANEDLLASVGVLLRRLHEASVGYAADRAFAAPPGASWFTRPLPSDTAADQVPVEPAPELVAHNDVTPQNVVVRKGRAVGLVDFDMAGPTTRLIDVYNTAMHWVPLRDPDDVWPTWTGLNQPRRLRVLADAYGLTDGERSSLIDLGVLRQPDLVADEGCRRASRRGLGPDVARRRRRADPPPAGLAAGQPGRPLGCTQLRQRSSNCTDERSSTGTLPQPRRLPGTGAHTFRSMREASSAWSKRLAWLALAVCVLAAVGAVVEVASGAGRAAAISALTAVSCLLLFTVYNTESRR